MLSKGSDINFDYNKLHLKTITILIPKNHVNLSSFLTPILGLYGIVVKDFVQELNQKLSFLNFDAVIPIRVFITKIKTFNLFFKTPYIKNLIFGISEKELSSLVFYKVFLIKSINNNCLLLNHDLNFSSKKYYLIRKYLSTLFISSQHKLDLFSLFSNKFFKKFIDLKAYRFLSFLKYGYFFVFLNKTSNAFLGFKNIFTDLNIYNFSSKFSKIFFNFSVNNAFFAGSDFFYKTVNFGLTKSQVFGSSLFFLFYKYGKNLLSFLFFQNFLSGFFLFKKKFSAIILNFLTTVINYYLKKILVYGLILFKLTKLLCRHIVN